MIDLDDAVSTAHRAASAIQTSFLKRRWKLGPKSEELRAQQAEQFLLFLIENEGSYACKKTALEEEVLHIGVVLERHQQDRKSLDDIERKKQDKNVWEAGANPKAVLQRVQVRLDEMNDMLEKMSQPTLGTTLREPKP